MTSALLGLLLVAVTACVVPTGEPQAIDQKDHEDLMAGTSTTSTTSSPLTDTVDIMLFYVGPDGRLESVSRPYEEAPQISEVLQALESPPRDEEQIAFQEQQLESQEPGVLVTEVPVGLQATLQGSPEDNAQGFRIVRVDPAAEFRERLVDNPSQARLAVSQLVCTFLNIDSLEGVDGVQFVDDRGEIVVTDSASQPINGPARKEDFGDCRTGTELLAEQLETEADAATGESTTTTTEAQS